MSKRCFVCGEDNSVVLHEHHIVPRRYGGSDSDENLVTLCANCHEAVEKIYDENFFRRLGFHTPKKPTPENATFDDYVAMVNQFIEGRVIADATSSTDTGEVYKEFKNFAEYNNYRAIPDRAMFGKALSESDKIEAERRQVRTDGEKRAVYDGVELKFG